MAAGSELYTPALSDALVILGAAGAIIPIFARFRITPVIGFILIGLLVGPHGLCRLVPQFPLLYHITIGQSDGLHVFAEFGIILLLFSTVLDPAKLYLKRWKAHFNFKKPCWWTLELRWAP